MTKLWEEVEQPNGRIAHRDRGQGRASVEAKPGRITWRRVQLEAQILAVLQAPPEPDERIEYAFRRKEDELMQLFAQLSTFDAMELHRRLTLCVSDDPIAARFMRLIVERRVRLLSYLAGARRREALRSAR